MRGLIFGVATNDAWYVTQPKEGDCCPAFRKWKDMISRVYSKKMLNNNPTYADVTVCDEWLTFSNFLKWYDENYIEGFELDKDLKVKGNKIYSPKSCLFVPPEVNRLFADKRILNKELPTGVSFHNQSGKYIARAGHKYLGLFETEEEALRVYNEAKNTKIKLLITQYKYLELVLTQHLSATI